MTRRILATGLASAALFIAVLGVPAPADAPAPTPSAAATAAVTASQSPTSSPAAAPTQAAAQAPTQTPASTGAPAATATDSPTPFPSPVRTTVATPGGSPTPGARHAAGGADRKAPSSSKLETQHVAKSNPSKATGRSCDSKSRRSTSTSGRDCARAKPKTTARSKPAPHSEPTPAIPAPRLSNSDGSPAPTNPSFSLATPGPAKIGVPNFFIDNFRIPPFLLPIYQAAGMQYGIRWQILAAINEIETDYGRNLNVSSAGAVGWMQFMPATWKQYGVDANGDGVKDPFNPVDAIFAAARYLKAAGGDKDVRRGIFAYNHANWYVDSVIMRAQVIGGLPDDLVSSLTGLTEGRFPVRARATYADALTKGQRRGHAAVLVQSQVQRKGIEIFARNGAPIVAVNDGKVVQVGRNRRLGRFIRIQDVYGNTYTYARLGSVAKTYPVPRSRGGARAGSGAKAPSDAAPSRPATRTTRTDVRRAARQGNRHRRSAPPAKVSAAATAAPLAAPAKQRLFAHPRRPAAWAAGGAAQVRVPAAPAATTATAGVDPTKFRLAKLRRGAQVPGGTVLGRIGATVPHVAPHLYFEIRPAGRGAPRIDPKPILDGWKLLESTAVYRAKGKSLFSTDSNGPSIGQIMLMGKDALGRRVLADSRIQIYPCGRDDIRAGVIDRRVLATLEFLASSGLKPTVSALRCGHSFLTASGNVSEHSTGTAVDIAAINGIPITGHQGPGSITDLTIQRLLTLQGTMKPHQIISLMTFQGADNTLALPDHYNHIHVGWRPMYGVNRKAAREIDQILKPNQWIKLIQRLGQIDNPTVAVKPSKWAIKVAPHGAGASGD